MLPDTLSQVYSSLRRFQRENRYSPTIRELAGMSGFCTQTVLDALNQMAGQGAIARSGPRKARRFYIPTEPNQYARYSSHA